jgi:transposase
MAVKYIVRLTEGERSELEVLIKKGKKVAARKRLHAQILLKADEGRLGPAWTGERIATAFEVHANTVSNIRQRFVEEGLEAALNRKPQANPSRLRKLDGEAEARLIAIACGAPPEGRVRWTMHLLADRIVELKIVDSISHDTVHRTLKKTKYARI